MSGGERARLALALITREAPHLLILDEPTNHLDVDAREALVQALNDYSGAVVVVSHDRHFLELTADRLILVAGGTATEFDGTLDDYRDLILARTAGESRGAEKPTSKVNRKEERRKAAQARERHQTLRKAVRDAEADMKKLTERRAEIDRIAFAPKDQADSSRGASLPELLQQRTAIERKLADAEERWLKASEVLEQAEAESLVDSA